MLIRQLYHGIGITPSMQEFKFTNNHCNTYNIFVKILSPWYISESLYVGLAHTVPPTQYKAFTAFSTKWLSEGSTSRYTCKEEQISSPEYLPSDCQRAKSRRTEIDKNGIFL